MVFEREEEAVEEFVGFGWHFRDVLARVDVGGAAGNREEMGGLSPSSGDHCSARLMTSREMGGILSLRRTEASSIAWLSA